MALIDFVTITPLLSLGAHQSVSATRLESALPEVQEVSPPGTPIAPKGRRRITNTNNMDTSSFPSFSPSDSVLVPDIETMTFEPDDFGTINEAGEYWGQGEVSELLNVNLNQMTLNDEESWFGETS